MPVESSTVARAAIVDLTIEQGADFSHIVSLKNGDGTIFPLAGYTAKMQIRQTVASASPLVELSTANGKITVNGAAGQLTLSLTNTETAAYTWRSGVYDLEITSPSAIVTRVMKGDITLSLEVTR